MNAVRSRSVKRKTSKARSRARWLCAVGCVAVLMVVAAMGLVRTDAQEAFPLPAIDPPGVKAGPPGGKAGPPSAQPAGMVAENADASDVAKQCANLWKMATELKSAVDKTSSGTLSVTVVRKAGEIEQLARKVRIANGKS
jgi:hypothetical protein